MDMENPAAGDGVPLAALNSGWGIPPLGFGTATPDPDPDGQRALFLDAIDAGYRHIDTAFAYRSEKTLGDAVAEAARRGLIRSRQDLFITSKLWCTDAEPELVLPALKRSLMNLRLEYLDLYLIHWPVRMKKKEIGTAVLPDDILPFDVRGTWAAMEECQRLGLAKSIGVSNFSCKKLSELLANATIPPAVNQMEVNPLWSQRNLREFCKEKGIHVTAYSPLGGNGAPWGTTAVMENPVLREIALAKGKSVAQICLRWVYEQGVSAVVKSFDGGRKRENFQIFDWELSEEERSRIGRIPQRRGCTAERFLSPAAATVEEF